MGQYTKKEAISIVVECAERYRDHLAGRNLLFICQDKHKRISTIEFSFDASNFLHLTGLKVREAKHISGRGKNSDDSVSAKDFYERCLAHRLSPNDFEFAEDGTTRLKLDILPKLMTRNLSATMIGDYKSRNPKLVTSKLAGGTVACMGFVPTGPANKYVPNTVLRSILGNVQVIWFVSLLFIGSLWMRMNMLSQRTLARKLTGTQYPSHRSTVICQNRYWNQRKRYSIKSRL